jgi:hypothetical protein
MIIEPIQIIANEKIINQDKLYPNETKKDKVCGREIRISNMKIIPMPTSDKIVPV